MARYAGNRKFEVFCKKVNKLAFTECMILSYSSTEFVRFNAIMAFSSMSRYRFFYGGLGETSNSLFPFLLSLLQYMPARRQVHLNTNPDSMLLSGVLAVMTFEITFLGSGVGVDYPYFENLIITAKLSVISD